MYKGVNCSQESRNNSTKNKMSVVLGITISAGLIIALALMVVITVYWKKFRAKQPLSKGQKLEIKIGLNKDDSMAFTLKEMIKATQNFGQKIGEGRFGTVFYGKLPDGKEIAVKVLNRMSSGAVQQFLNEINLISRVHHKNLVSFLGYCTESKESILIYEYTSNGSLWKHLHGQSTGLNWKTRLKIAIGAAEGLQYLHVCCTPMIIHRDVKSRNILLDSNLNGNLCNLELSMMTMDRKVPIETQVAGTVGYEDPEYYYTQQLTQKSDVYSFGVVLLEIICGREIIDANLPDEERNLISWVKEYVRINEDPAKIVEIIDKKMDGNYDMRSISIVAKLALRCVEFRSSLRPSISELVGDLKEAIMYEKVYKAPVAKHGYSRGGVIIQDGRYP